MMHVTVQLTVTVEEARLLYEAVRDKVETMYRMGLGGDAETESLVLMRGALSQFAEKKEE